MKYLLLLVLLVVVFYKLTNRRDERPAERKPAPPPPPQDMVRCARCGVHLPADEAFPGRGGQFCSAAHRAEFERS
jgi:uncharacterized protein